MMKHLNLRRPEPNNVCFRPYERSEMRISTGQINTFQIEVKRRVTAKLKPVVDPVRLSLWSME
jgi:hypothetical protein